jgi:hypothetical protein
MVTPALNWQGICKCLVTKDAIVAYLARPVVCPGHESVSPQVEEGYLMHISDEDKFQAFASSLELQPASVLDPL